MKTKIISLVIILIALAAVFLGVSKIIQPNTITDNEVVMREFCSPAVLKLATSTGETYVNTALGFSFFLPQGWKVPQSTDNDPHFYNCATRDGFEISGGWAGEGFYKSLESEYLNPEDTETIEIYEELIPGAIVRLYRIKDLDHAPWGYTHVMLFPKEMKALLFISKKYADQREFLKTFKLIK